MFVRGKGMEMMSHGGGGAAPGPPSQVMARRPLLPKPPCVSVGFSHICWLFHLLFMGLCVGCWAGGRGSGPGDGWAPISNRGRVLASKVDVWTDRRSVTRVAERV